MKMTVIFYFKFLMCCSHLFRPLCTNINDQNKSLPFFSFPEHVMVSTTFHLLLRYNSELTVDKMEEFGEEEVDNEFTLQQEALSLEKWLELLESEGPYVRCVDMISSFKLEGSVIKWSMLYMEQRTLSKSYRK